MLDYLELNRIEFAKFVCPVLNLKKSKIKKKFNKNRPLGCVVAEMVTYKKTFSESSPARIREKIENYDSKTCLSSLQNIRGEEAKPIIRQVVEK